MRKRRVLVVDDSAFMRKAISRIIESDENFKVVETARDGFEALEKIPQCNPDVITLDVEMPKMNGLETLEEMGKRNIKVPVIIVSSISWFGSNMSIRCLEAGAFDIVRKPESYVSMDIHKISADLIMKLKAATDILTKKRKISWEVEEKVEKKPTQTKVVPRRVRFKAGRQQIITIGSSTGGPVALNNILSKLPQDLPAAIVIVQHMPQGNFIFSLAERLNSYSQLEVRVAENGDILQDGLALVAPIGWHLILDKYGDTYKAVLTKHPRDLLHCPSVDVLFESAGNVVGNNNISCILTGMGSDGTKGLEFVFKNHGYIIAESEETCVVYGMPRSAVEAGFVNKIVPLDRIPDVLKDILNY